MAGMRPNGKTICRFIVLMVVLNVIAVFLYKKKTIVATMRQNLAFHETKLLRISPAHSLAEAEEIFHKGAAALEVNCPESQRLGKRQDGGWDVCVYGAYKFKSPCLVYSFGINNDWSFDDDVVAKFGCTVRAFDPSMSVADHTRGKHIYFYKQGIGGKEEVRQNGWHLKTLEGFINALNDTGVIIDYLKIDVEYSEWDSLDQILKGSILSKVKQLGIEIHTNEYHYKQRKVSSSLEDYIRYSDILRRLQKIGFYRWNWHFNHFGNFTSKHSQTIFSCCYEMVFLNVDFPI